MKKSDKKELKMLSVEDLQEKVGAAHTALFRLRSDKSMQKKTESAHAFKETRRQIARLKTWIRQKQQAVLRG